MNAGCSVFKLLRRSVDGKHLIRFQRETSVFKFLRRSEDRALSGAPLNYLACLSYLQVNCTGNETRLENCDHPPWGKHSCGHFEDAGVRCVGPDTTRECVDECGDGYFKVKGRMECGVCMASCLKCANSASNCTSCDKLRFLKGNACGL